MSLLQRCSRGECSYLRLCPASQTTARARVRTRNLIYFLFTAIGRLAPDAPCHDSSRMGFVTGGVDS
eukprot:3656978-Alexandrium_andersonii.AAC.1